MKIVGLTGGIGSGKTTVANFFKDEGIPVYIADKEAKKLMLTQEVKTEIISLLGKEAYKGEEPDRAWIASKVFKNASLLAQLNSIIHPRVHQHFKQWVSQQNSSYVIYEAAIIFETGTAKNFDYIILVTAPEEVRLERVMKRDNTTKKEIQVRIDRQWPEQKKKELANFVIENTTITATKAAVKKLHKDLLMLANA